MYKQWTEVFGQIQFSMYFSSFEFNFKSNQPPCRPIITIAYNSEMSAPLDVTI